MRWFVAAVLWGVCGVVSAGEVFLIPADNPKPVYPRPTYRAGIEGEVRVSLFVNADGIVSQVTAPKDAQPELAEAALTAVRQWRYEPWAVSAERPARIEVIAPMIFRLDDTPPVHANQPLKKVRCADLSRMASRYMEYFWIDLPMFNWTRSYLTHSISPSQLSDEKRLELIAKLNRDVPSIIWRCNTQPSSRAVRFFPKEVRELL
ncbi:periplasmic protein TonB [Pseudomonas sp. IT-P12]|uniref:energy transducer TonB n=1 Tax=Pseudomonas sp. IT-P12 TaxID=3026450 RepID=UPI0039DFB3D8